MPAVLASAVSDDTSSRMTCDRPRCAASVREPVRGRVVCPEARSVDAEQGERLVDDVVEQSGQFAPAAHLRRDRARASARVRSGGA